MTDEQAPPRPVRDCFGCGPDNPHGLQLRFRLQDGIAVARFDPTATYQGYPGVLHGGLVATLLDEAMSWALILQDVWAQTARMEIRYRRNAPADRPLLTSGRVTRDRGRSLVVKGTLTGDDGTLYAEAEGLFFRLPGRVRADLRRRYGVD